MKKYYHVGHLSGMHKLLNSKDEEILSEQFEIHRCAGTGEGGGRAGRSAEGAEEEAPLA
jgi:hypothetical protein